MRQAGGLQDMLADSLTSPTLMCIGAEAEKPAQQTAVKQIDRLAVYLGQRQDRDNRAQPPQQKGLNTDFT